MLTVVNSSEAADILVNKEFIMISEGKAYKLTSDGNQVYQEELNRLHSTQEETDTRIILYCLYAKEQGYSSAVIRSPDSDIFFILLHYAAKLNPLKIYFDTGRNPKRRLIDVSQLAQDLTPRYCEAVMGLYVFTGEDANCSFKGKGKIQPMKKLIKKQKYMNTFLELGKEWIPSDKTINECNEFVCLMYGFPNQTSVNKVRTSMIKKMTSGKEVNVKSVKKVDLSKLPPCERSLTPHIRRVAYRLALWKRAHIASPIVPKPTEEYGWCQSGEFLEPVWSEGPVLPESLWDVISDNYDSDNDDSEEEDSESSDDESSSSSSDSDFD